MASASITVRTTKAGKRYVVRYRLGGRAYPIVHGGSFPTMREARARRDFIAGELAAGRNPADALRAMVERPEIRTFADVFDGFTASRVDVSEATLENYKTHRTRLVDLIGDRDPATLTWQDVQAVIAGLSGDLSPLSVRQYVATLRQVLDFADVDPNPARDRRVKLPRPAEALVDPPSETAVAAIIANVPPRWRLALRVLEQTGMRVGELGKLEWGDVDVAASRFRVRSGKTRAARRWVTVPEWVMLEVEASCPPDDRTPERRVFPGATRQTIGMAMRKACEAAGIAHHHPHDLRHRYASVKIAEVVPVTDLAAQLGHAKKSLTLDTYSHVLLES
jgi:integrase